MLVGVGIVLLTNWGVDYFILSRYRTKELQEYRSGQVFSAPETEQTFRPLKLGVAFSQAKRVSPVVVTELNTDWGALTFTSEGAALERLEFIRKNDQTEDVITTIFPTIEREHKAFIVALDQNTPYYYNLVDTSEDDQYFFLTYEGSYEKGLLRKRFAVAKHIYKIDLTIELLASSHAIQNQIRLFLPAPVMPDIKYDTVSALVNNIKGSIEKIPYNKLNGQEGWWAPTIFGTENKYFVHALVADQNNFAQRAYFLMAPENRLISILEGPSVVPQETYSWTMSFYCGPKEAHAMNQVNTQLEETLDYSGILAPLSKLLLKLLNFLYEYVHNYGLAILLLTVLIKLIMLPFTISGERGLKKSNEVQKKMRYLEQKYKNDPEKLRIAQAEVIKKHGLPQLASCLPMLAQFPIFIALSRVLNNSVDLYQAPFFGWITDLSAPDPYYILPALLIGGMILQGLSGDPAQRMVTLTAALVFGAVSANFAAGLVLYICASTLLSVMQIMIQKSVKAV